MGGWDRHVYRWAAVGVIALALCCAVAWPVVRRPMMTQGVAGAGPVGAVRQEGGLRFALSLPRGPYFRDELLPVTLTLTNDSGAPIPYSGALSPGPCRSMALNAALIGNGQYMSPFPAGFYPPAYSCLAIPLNAAGTPLRPGASLHMRVLLALPAAGRLTVTGQASFPRGARIAAGGPLAAGGWWGGLRSFVPGLFRSYHAPFAAGGPSITIGVAPRAPAGRMLRLALHGRTAYLQGYVGVPHPMFMDTAADGDELGMSMTGTPIWTPLASAGLHDPWGSAHEKWQVLVGAPGYAIASAVYCFNPAPSLVFGGVPGSPRTPPPPCTQTIHDISGP